MFFRFASMALIAVTVLSVFLIGSDHAAPQVAMVIVEIDQDIMVLDVGPNGNGTAVITGRVYLPYPNNPLVDHVEVVLKPDLPDFAGLVLSAYDFTLSALEPEAGFQGNLTVPSSTSSSLTGNVMIDGTAVVYPSMTPAQVEEDTASIEILPYYGAALYFQQVYGKIGSDGSGTFVLQLNNTGNAIDTYTLSLLDAPSLRSKGMIVVFEETHTVPEGGSAQVKIEVKVKGADRGSYTIRIGATSQGKGTNEPEMSVAVLTLTVEDNVIKFLQGNPYVLLGALAAALLLIAASSIGVSIYVKRRRWKRQFERMLDSTANQNRGITPPDPRYPPPG